MKTKFALSTMIGVLLAGSASASPSINLYVAGSTIVVEASNSEDKAYSCHGSYKATYNQFGTAGEQVFPANFSVPAKSQGAVVTQSTGWAASGLNAFWVNGPQCN